MKTDPPSPFSNVASAPPSPEQHRKQLAAVLEELPRIDTSPRPRRVIVPMDVLPMWPEIERLAQEGYEELANADLPLELVGAFLESPEMKAEGTTPLAERARLYLERISREE